jgi:hypothetical protein
MGTTGHLLRVDVTYNHNFLQFCQLSANKLAFFLKSTVMINILQTPAVCSLNKKHEYFCQVFRRKYFFESQHRS